MSYATIVWKNKKTGKLVRNVVYSENHLINYLFSFRVPVFSVGEILRDLGDRSRFKTSLKGRSWSCVIFKNDGLFSKNYKGKLCAD